MHVEDATTSVADALPAACKENCSILFIKLYYKTEKEKYGR